MCAVIQPPSSPDGDAYLNSLLRRLKTLIVPDYILASRQYHHRNGVYPDLKDPKDLSEKVLWLKLHDQSPLHTFCADKILVRDYVAHRIGAPFLVPALLTTYQLERVTPEAIAEPRFVIKTNHDQGGVFICLDRGKIKWPEVHAQLRARLRTNKYYEYQERQYKDIRPGVLVERFIEGDAGGSPVELKVNCFQGAPRVIQVILDRFGRRRQAFYDQDWTLLPMHGRAAPAEPIPRPARLDEILAAAATLAEPFLFVRADFLLGAGGRGWFGEMTFHPAAGLVRYNPPAMERALGDLIDIRRFKEFRRIQRRIWDAGFRPKAPPPPPLRGAL
jgi:hypothetical protein